MSRDQTSGQQLPPQLGSRIAAVIAATMLGACSNPPQPPTPKPGPATTQVVTQPSGTTVPGNLANQTFRLQNGLASYIETTAVGSEAQVQLAVLAGSLFVAPGLAELAATVLLESSDPATGRASLKRRIEALGGSIDVKIGLMTTWFDIRVNFGRMPQALVALRESLDSVTQSRSQIERMRGELVASLSAQIQADPMPLATKMLLHAERGTGQYLHSLLDLDPSEVSLFHSRLYRPDRCMLAVAAPRRLPDIIEPLGATDAIAGWLPPPPVPGAIKVIERKFEPGVYWATVPGKPGWVRAAFVMRLPDPTMFGAAEWLVMHSCLTLGGRGGRLERMQEEAGLAHILWQARIEQTPDALALVMSTDANYTDAAALWRVLNRARQSLLEVPPTASELQLALRRAQLNADLPNLTSNDRLRLAANIKTLGVTSGGLLARLQEMTDLTKWDVRKAATAFQETPAWMVVVGAGRPDDLPGLVPFELQPAGFAPINKDAATATAIASTGSWLVSARAAMGGGEYFQQLLGFTATSTIVADKAPTARDEIAWLQSGKLTRKRTVLNQTLVTEIDGTTSSEQLDKIRKSLEVREAQLLRHEMRRHPMMLLAANARGTLQFRPIAQRSTGDRGLMVLEALGDEFDRLRIHIDTESFLIRTVESWERLPDETLVHVHESWSDYRAAGPMRAPYRCRTTWNDGEHQTETQYSAWSPVLAK